MFAVNVTCLSPLFPLLILILSFFLKHFSMCRRESLSCLLAAVRYITWTEHDRQPALVSVSIQQSIRLAVGGGGGQAGRQGPHPIFMMPP